ETHREPDQRVTGRESERRAANLRFDTGDPDLDRSTERSQGDPILEADDAVERRLIRVGRVRPLHGIHSEARILTPWVIERVRIGREAALESSAAPYRRRLDRGQVEPGQGIGPPDHLHCRIVLALAGSGRQYLHLDGLPAKARTIRQWRW